MASSSISFIYKANDGELDSNLATVSLNVTPVNDAPTLGDLNLFNLPANQVVELGTKVML